LEFKINREQNRKLEKKKKKKGIGAWAESPVRGPFISPTRAAHIRLSRDSTWTRALCHAGPACQRIFSRARRAPIPGATGQSMHGLALGHCRVGSRCHYHPLAPSSPQPNPLIPRGRITIDAWIPPAAPSADAKVPGPHQRLHPHP
jgi:hypothetical protein